MRPEVFARTLAIIGTVLFVFAAILRLFSAYILTVDTRFVPNPPPPDRQPMMGQYTTSNFDQYVTFLKGVTVPSQEGGDPNLWVGTRYTLDLATGDVSAGAPPSNFSDPGWFAIKENGELQINDENVRVGLLGDQLIQYKITEYGESLAYVVEGLEGRWELYVVRGAPRVAMVEVPFRRVAVEESFADISWDIHGMFVTYVAPRDGVDQVFLYSYQSDEVTQLTFDEAQKSNPVISPGDKMVAYLSTRHVEVPNTILRRTPTPFTFPAQPVVGVMPEYMSPPNNNRLVTPEVYVIGADGQNGRQLTSNDTAEFNLGWTAEGEVLYSVWREEWPKVAWLYAANPASGEPRRLFPGTAVDSISCSPDLLGANKATVKAEVSNTSNQVTTVPVELAVDRVPVDVVSARSQHRVLREDLTLQPGESKAFEWTVNVPDDQRAYFAVTVESGDEFPISAAFCSVAQRTLLMPRLRWLGWSFALVSLGFVLSIPWLRHQKSPWLWRVWGVFVVLLLVLVLIEGLVVVGALA